MSLYEGGEKIRKSQSENVRRENECTLKFIWWHVKCRIPNGKSYRPQFIEIFHARTRTHTHIADRIIILGISDVQCEPPRKDKRKRERDETDRRKNQHEKNHYKSVWIMHVTRMRTCVYRRKCKLARTQTVGWLTACRKLAAFLSSSPSLVTEHQRRNKYEKKITRVAIPIKQPRHSSWIQNERQRERNKK